MVGKVTPDDRASASLLPAIMGISKYASPNDALMGCINAINGKPRPDITNESMEWGNTFEEPILKEAAMRLGLDNLDISHGHAIPHPYLPFSCSLDGTAWGRGLRVETDEDRGIFVVGQDSIILDGIGVLEAKLTAMDAEDVPPLWRGPVQLQAQMDATGSTWGALCTLYRGTQLRIFLFAPHPATVEAIGQAVTDFERRLEKYRQDGTVEHYPPKDSRDADRMWNTADEGLSDPLGLGAAENNLCQEIRNLQAQIKLAENEIDQKMATLKEKMKEWPRAVTPEFEIRWPMRRYQAQPERVVPAKPPSVVRQSTLTIKERK
jgi:predicted phage-related endonuclease